MALIYDELHALAEESFRGERGGHTLQPTALVHEAWIRLVGGAPVEWQGRSHFLRVAARAMRHVLVDHARGRSRLKRGRRSAADPDDLDRLLFAFEERSIDVVDLNDLLERLSSFDEKLARVVELRYFAGLSVPEVAEVLGTSTTTVERSWRLARAWLQHEMARPG